ncbi:acetyl-CoA synthetase-like protein [Hypoxylon fragiforme]|uniref:acetyl-CoA synthetase-like protein n=1 Tax=Hypoxylon fragiforme TaxID=63214 RepID=UPI0020C5DE64|nr:acetyl-CoA synthetase-like protein [Hypoxylon fragiforme]KAI2605985.1 acetyl-CoA synthetase-like protein [Hypoxylon fragiforme]
MVITSRWTAPIPKCSLQQWVFESSFGALSNEPQFIDPDRPETHFITKSDFRLWSKRFALGLVRAGLKPGDRVLLFSGNSLFFPVVFMGILMAGGIFSGANPSFVPRELAYQLKDTGALFMIAADASMEIAVEAAAEAGLPRSQIFSFDATPLDTQPGKARLGTRHWTSLLAPEAEGAKFDWVEPADATTAICALNYSSGTTGVPKGVEITHYSYVANGVGVTYVDQVDSDYEEKRKRARRLGFLPMYHAYGQTYLICNFPKEDIPVYIMPSFNFEKMLQYIEKYRIDLLTGVPPILVMLAKSPLSRKYDLSSIEVIGSGAAPLGAEVCDEVAKLWPPGALRVRQGWGMTELTCTCTVWDPYATGQSSAVGELMVNCKARIMKTDGSGEITKANENGEIWISAPTLLKGYWGKPEATASTLHIDPDGTRWLKTGDVAFVDKYEQGALIHIVDRMKELIKVKANQVAPAELEALLLDNRGVNDAAVVGVVINGEEAPRAYIVPNPEKKQTEKEIAKWLESRVVYYKRLTGGVKFVDAIPKNPSGKILRNILRQQAAKEVGDRKPTASKLS